jgi:hypothetical protein
MDNQENQELEFESEFIPASEYVACAFYALSAIDGMDPMIMQKREAGMIEEIKYKSLEIIHHYINIYYDETFAEADTTDDDGDLTI